MIKLTRMRLVNWQAYWDKIIEYGDMTLISAKNGTGKSVMDDAFRYATYEDADFNLAADTGKSKRTIASYVRGQIQSGSPECMRPESKYKTLTGHIVTEWYDTSTKKNFILGTIIDVRGDSSETKRYVMKDAVLEDVPCTYNDDNGRKFVNDIKKFQEDTKVPMMNRAEAIPVFARMQGLPQSKTVRKEFVRKVHSILAYNPDSNIQQFIHDKVLPSKDVTVLGDIKDYQKSIDDLSEEMDHTMEQLRILNEVLDGLNSYQKEDELIRKNEICLELDKQRTCEQAVNQIASQKQRLETQKNAAQKKLQDFRDKEHDIKEDIHDIEKELSDGDIGYMQDRLAKLEETKEEREKEQQRLNDFQDLICEAGETIPELAWMAEDESLQNINDPSTDVATKQISVSRARNEIDKLRDRYNEDLTHLRDREKDLKEKIKMQKDKINAGANHQIQDSRMNDFVGLRDEINAEFKKRNIDSQAWLAYQYVVDMTDESWRDALESYLGDRRYCVLVDPAYYDIADAVFTKTRYKYAHLFNTRKLMDWNIIFAEHPASDFLEIEDEVTKKYFEYRLGGLEATDEMQVKNYSNAIAKTGKVSMNMDNYFSNARKTGTYCLGRAAYEKNQKIAKKVLNSLYDDLNDANASIKEKEAVCKSLSQYREEFHEYDFDIDRKLAQTIEDITETNKTLQALEKDDKENPLRKRLKRKQSELDTNKKKQEENSNECAVLESKIEGLNETLSETQKQLDNAKTSMDTERENYPAESEEVERRYDAPKRPMRPWKETATRDHNEARENAKYAVIKGQTEYRAKDPEAPNAFDNKEWYLNRRDYVEVHDAKKIQADLNQQTREQSEVFKRDFAQAIRNNGEEAYQTMMSINKELKKHPFSGTTYQFSMKPRKDDGHEYGKILEYADKTKDEMNRYTPQGELFDAGMTLSLTEEDNTLVKDMNDIISKITSGDDLNNYADYRNYYDYDVLIDNETLHHASLAQQSRVGSGAEIQIPYLLMLLSALMITYTPNSSRLIMMDEACSKMDPSKIRQMLTFMKDQDLQGIFYVPERVDGFVDVCDKMWEMEKVNQHIKIQPLIDDEEENQPVMVSMAYQDKETD